MKIKDTEQLRVLLEAHLYWAGETGHDANQGPMDWEDGWSGFLDRALELLEGN